MKSYSIRAKNKRFFTLGIHKKTKTWSWHKFLAEIEPDPIFPYLAFYLIPNTMRLISVFALLNTIL